MALDTIVGFTQIEQSVANHALQANNAMGDLAQAAAGYLAKSVAAGGTINLTLDESQYSVIDLTGAPGSNVTVVQHADAPKVTLYRNLTTGLKAVEVKLGAGGTAFRVPAGQSLYLLSSTQSLDPDTKAKHDGCYFFTDFEGPERQVFHTLALFTNNASTPDENRVTTVNGDIISCIFRVRRAGLLQGVAYVGEDGLATSNTDYVQFSMVNKLRNGSGAVDMLNTGDVNTTKTTGGSALTAYMSRSLSLNATTENLCVMPGDVIEVKMTVVAATALGNVINRPTINLLFSELPEHTWPLAASDTGIGAPLISLDPAFTSKLGEAVLKPTSSAGVSDAGMNWNGRAFFNASKGLRFRCRAKISAASANQDKVWGLCSGVVGIAHDSIVHSVWFRQEATSLDLLWESDDGSNDDDDNDTTLDLVADTYADYEIDMTVLAAVLFKVNGVIVGTANMSSLPADTGLMPEFSNRRASGTAQDEMTVDWYEVSTQSR